MDSKDNLPLEQFFVDLKHQVDQALNHAFVVHQITPDLIEMPYHDPKGLSVALRRKKINTINFSPINKLPHMVLVDQFDHYGVLLRLAFRCATSNYYESDDYFKAYYDQYIENAVNETLVHEGAHMKPFIDYNKHSRFQFTVGFIKERNNGNIVVSRGIVP